MQRRKYDKKEALSKLMKYCSYQDRCHKEVESKLREWFIWGEDRDEIVYELMQHDFLNEERFARSYVRGKFKIKKWGRIKIKSGLKEKGITDNLIRIAMKEIDEDAYFNTLKNELEKKQKSLSEDNEFIKNKKVAEHLIRRGFEADLVWQFLKS